MNEHVQNGASKFSLLVIDHTKINARPIGELNVPDGST